MYNKEDLFTSTLKKVTDFVQVKNHFHEIFPLLLEFPVRFRFFCTKKFEFFGFYGFNPKGTPKMVEYDTFLLGKFNEFSVKSFCKLGFTFFKDSINIKPDAQIDFL